MDKLFNTPTAVLLDWDEHLIDSSAYYRVCSELAMKIAIERHGYAQPNDLYRERGLLKSHEYFTKYFGEEGAKVIHDIREEVLTDHSRPAPILKAGAKELLTLLAQNNIPYAIVSDTIQPRLENNVTRTLNDNGLPTPVLVGTIPGEVDKKPSPAGIIKALNILQVAPSPAVLFSGDLPLKDGLAAANAGVSSVIIPADKSGDVSESNVCNSLEDLVIALSATLGKKLERPRYFKRFSYEGIPEEETRIIAGEKYYVESPTSDDPTESSIVLTEEETIFHNKRWIAKRGKNLDGSGNYPVEDKMAAAYEVVEELVTAKMINEIAAKSLQSARLKRQKTPADEKIIIHIPHIGNSKNMLRVAFINKLVHELNEIFAKQYPELNVEFKDSITPGSPIFNVLSIAQSLEIEDGITQDDIESLSGFDVNSSLTIRRSTGTLSERIVKQALFEFQNFKEGDLVILADDHVQAGSTFILLYQQLKQREVDIVALTSLAVIPESKNLQPHKDVEMDIDQALKYSLENYIKEFPNADEKKMEVKFKKSLDDALGKVGLSVKSLSCREALSVVAFFIDGKNNEQNAWFQKMMDKYGCDKSVVERKEDSLLVQAELPPVTPVEFLHQIDSLIPRFTVRSL